MIVTGAVGDWEYLGRGTNQSLKSAFSGGSHDRCSVECRYLRGAGSVHCRLQRVGAQASSVTLIKGATIADLKKRIVLAVNGQARRDWAPVSLYASNVAAPHLRRAHEARQSSAQD